MYLLHEAIQHHRLVYTATFDKLVEVHQESTVEDITDQPYNNHLEANRHNLDHQLLNSEEIYQVSDVVDAVLFFGGHYVIFCLYVQFLKW